jgi:hypothetical protein
MINTVIMNTKKEEERKIQIQVEIDWLKAKITTGLKPKHRKQLEHQIKKKEYDLGLGIFSR